MVKKIKGLYEGKGFRLFNGERYKLEQTAKNKRELDASAKEMRSRGYKVRIVPISIGYAEYIKRN